MANVLVTGGAGYVGSVCCAELLQLGHSVSIIDDLSTGFRDSVPDHAEFIQMDYGDRSALNQFLRARVFDAVFHFAARAQITESMRDPGVFFRQNVGSSITMLEELRQAGLSKFVFSSSAAVYGIQGDAPISEETPKNPLNPYGLSKLMLEQTLEWYAKAYGWSVTVFRYFNAAGATRQLGERHHPETHIIPLLLQVAAGEKEQFEIYGQDYQTPDGTCLRDYVHVLDIARAHISVLGKLGPPGMRAYNIGTGSAHSVRELCEAAARATGRSIPVCVSSRRPGDPPVLCASYTRIREELGWNAEHSSLLEIMSSAWEWKQRQLGKLFQTARE
jgi:UDP-glucose 4-epimerase